ncbi:biotin/lipoyl-containing protein [Chloroflexota bacterium]
MKYQVTVAGRSFEIEVDHERLVRVNGQPLYVDLEQVGGLPVYSLALEQDGYVVFVEKGQEEYLVEVQGKLLPVNVQRQRLQPSAKQVRCSGDDPECLAISAPLAGRVVALPPKVGDRVEKGQVVAVIESMKMQMELKAPEAGVVDAVHGPPHRQVRRGDELVILRAG